MNGSPSPSPSPRRLQRQRPGSPLAAQLRQNNQNQNQDNNNNKSNNNNNNNGSSEPNGSDSSRLHPVSRLDGPAPSLASPRSYQLSKSPAPSHSHSRSYSQSYSPSYNLSYGSPNTESNDADNNYGYRPKYNIKDDDDNNNNNNNSSSTTSPSLRPVQEYHNAFTSEGEALSLPPTPSATGSSSPTSKFATISSASRAFFEHRRQSSIPNLMPAISSIGRNLGRAISPDRPLRSFSPAKRPPIPEYRDESASRRESSESSDDDDDDDDESVSSDESSSEEDDEDDEDDDDSMDGSDNEEDVGRDRSSRAAPFSGDSRSARRKSTLTTRADDDDKQADTVPATSGFASWLAGGGTPKATSPERSSILTTSRTTTPEPSVFRGRQGHTRRSMSLASNASTTPRSPFMGNYNASPSRLSQLATTMSATLSRLAQPQPLSPRSAGAGFERDELFNLDVDAALFPAGRPSDRDAFSPAAYKNLEMNAINALRRMQAAYRQRSVALQDVTAEKSVCDEEFEEAETRAQHLKMQLEGMARRVADQQREMEGLMDELAAEKKARAQERAMLLSGVPTAGSMADGTGAMGIAADDHDHDQATSIVALSEDLDVDKAQRDQKRRSAWRRRSSKSNGSSLDDTDDGDEADEAESSASVFSRPRSPTPAPGASSSSSSSSAGLDSGAPVHHPRVAALGSTRQQNGRSVSTVSSVSSSASLASSTAGTQNQPMTTFQKLMKNVTAAIKDEEPELGSGTTSCRNCGGRDVSFAWNTVSVLRDENKHLKQRVGQLEVAVEGALDMVNGVGL